MKRIYSRTRIALMAFALGLAGVYMGNGISIGMSTIPIDLPKIDSEDEVLFIFASNERDASPYYIPKQGEIANGRDLSLYDQGGYVDSCIGINDNEWEDCLTRRNAARRFVLDHWTEKRRGYIQIGHPCVDCSPVDHIFIEPDPSDEWRIVITLETNAPLRTEEASDVRLRRAKREERWRTDSATVLVFIDGLRREIDYF